MFIPPGICIVEEKLLSPPYLLLGRLQRNCERYEAAICLTNHYLMGIGRLS